MQVFVEHFEKINWDNDEQLEGLHLDEINTMDNPSLNKLFTVDDNEKVVQMLKNNKARLTTKLLKVPSPNYLSEVFAKILIFNVGNWYSSAELVKRLY